MKKVLLIVAAIAMVFSFNSCKKDSSNSDGSTSTLVTKYVGSYTFFKYNEDASAISFNSAAEAQQNGEEVEQVQQQKTVQVFQLTPDRIRLYYVLPMDRVANSVNSYENSALTTAIVTELITMLGAGQYAQAAQNFRCVATLTENHLSYKVVYDVPMTVVGVPLNIEVRVMQFEGDKVEE